MRQAPARPFRFSAVIPGRAQCEPGIQWYLQGARLDPGSALRAVRDDIRRRSGPSGMTLEEAKAHTSFAVIPAKAGIQWYLRGARLDFGSALRAVRDDIRRERAGPG